MWAPHLRRKTPFFLENWLIDWVRLNVPPNWRPFLVITVCHLSILQCHPYLFSPGKLLLATFFGHYCRLYSFHSFTRVSPIISGMLLYCKKLPLLLWGPFFVGPLFGRTCWPCQNPPLVVWSL